MSRGYFAWGVIVWEVYIRGYYLGGICLGGICPRTVSVLLLLKSYFYVILLAFKESRYSWEKLTI